MELDKKFSRQITNKITKTAKFFQSFLTKIQTKIQKKIQKYHKTCQRPKNPSPSLNHRQAQNLGRKWLRTSAIINQKLTENQQTNSPDTLKL